MKLKFHLSFFFVLIILGFTKSRNLTMLPEGNWIMCKIICSEIETNLNQCTKISFFDNGQGIIEKPNGKSEFLWKMNDETIEFHFKDMAAKDSFIFKDSILYYMMWNKRKTVELRLETENPKCTYVLSRENR